MKLDLLEEIEVPEGVEVNYESNNLKVKGKDSEISRMINTPKVNISVKDKKVVLEAKKATKREKMHLKTIKAHINNMLSGVLEKHYYKLKICSSHFPVSAAAKGKEFSVSNFLGEKVPRTCKIPENVDVKVEGDMITVESPDKEAAGRAASSIEQLCRITDKDRRIFQDGIYMINKDGKEITS